MDSIIFLCLSLVLAAIGVGMVVQHGALVGWILTGLGACGLGALIIKSVMAQAGTRPSYANFLAGTFFFFVFLGMTVGLWMGKSGHSFWLEALGFCGGIVIGYGVGLLAGFWFQCLGWIAALLDMILAVAIIGLIVIDISVLVLPFAQ
ncbi:MAG: hypothetical protein HQL13_04870 [Candidatus Omnitrophica bacterium]|nr:hypothetical protein [Candidatus Omnitrophota bacterium]